MLRKLLSCLLRVPQVSTAAKLDDVDYVFAPLTEVSPTVEPGTVVVCAPAGSSLEDVRSALCSAATESGMYLVVGGAKPWKNQPQPERVVFF